MTAAEKDLTIEQGATFSFTLVVRNDSGDIIDLTGYSAEMQVRTRKGEASTILDLSTTGGEIVINGPAGTITVTVDAATTTALTPSQGNVYDIKMTSPGGAATRLLEGGVLIDPEVTR